MTNSQLPPGPPAATGFNSAAAPSPYTTSGPTPPKTGNGLGIAALIVGIVALVGSFIPFVNFATGFIAFVGLVLGVIALFLKGRPKKAAIAGTIVSVIALILSIVLSVAYTAGFVAAVDDAVESGGVGVSESPAAGDDAATDDDADADDAATDNQGTRENPYPIGTTLSFTENGNPFYDITVGAPTLNANDVVAAANQFNEAAPAGTQYAILPLTVTYTGSTTGTPWLDIAAEFVTVDGTSHTTSDALVAVPGTLLDLNELYTGGSGTGNIVVNVPTANIEQGTWHITVGVIGGEEAFFAAQ
jgi:hypothetical protein